MQKINLAEYHFNVAGRPTTYVQSMSNLNIVNIVKYEHSIKKTYIYVNNGRHKTEPPHQKLLPIP